MYVDGNILKVKVLVLWTVYFDWYITGILQVFWNGQRTGIYTGFLVVGHWILQPRTIHVPKHDNMGTLLIRYYCIPNDMMLRKF